MTPLKITLKPFLKLILIAACYFLAARLGLLIAYEHTNVSPIWPPSGLALALVIILGYRIWPAIWLGAFIANAVVFASNNVATTPCLIGMSATIATGNTLEALVCLYLINKTIDIKEFLEKHQYIFWFIASSVIAAGASATFGIISLYLGNVITSDNLLSIWHTWILGDIAGIIMFTPLILAWSGKYKTSEKANTTLYNLEFGLNILLIILLSYFLFIYSTQANLVKLRPYMILPFLIWSVFRFKQREVITALAIVSCFAIAGTIHSHGPFVEYNLNQSLIELQSFVTVITVSFLSLSASLAEQRIIRNILEDSHTELELKVSERTRAFFPAQWDPKLGIHVT